MEKVANRVEAMTPLGDPDVMASVTLMSAKTREELRCQFESVAEFADLCAFVTAGRSSDRAAQMVAVAEVLLAESMQALGQTAASGSGEAGALEQDRR
jgi:hypothetical protein